MRGVDGEGDVLTYVSSGSTALSVSVTSHQEVSLTRQLSIAMMESSSHVSQRATTCGFWASVSNLKLSILESRLRQFKLTMFRFSFGADVEVDEMDRSDIEVLLL